MVAVGAMYHSNCRKKLHNKCRIHNNRKSSDIKNFGMIQGKFTRKRHASFPDIKTNQGFCLSASAKLTSYKYVIIHSNTVNTNMRLKIKLYTIYTYTYIQRDTILTHTRTHKHTQRHTHTHVTHTYTLFSHNFKINALQSLGSCVSVLI